MIYLNIHSIKINVFIKNRKNYIEKIIMVIFDKILRKIKFLL